MLVESLFEDSWLWKLEDPLLMVRYAKGNWSFWHHWLVINFSFLFFFDYFKFFFFQRWWSMLLRAAAFWYRIKAIKSRWRVSIFLCHLIESNLLQWRCQKLALKMQTFSARLHIVHTFTNSWFWWILLLIWVKRYWTHPRELMWIWVGILGLVRVWVWAWPLCQNLCEELIFAQRRIMWALLTVSILSIPRPWPTFLVTAFLPNFVKIGFITIIGQY